MQRVEVADFATWRRAARALLHAKTPYTGVTWQTPAQHGLAFEAVALDAAPADFELRVPRALATLLEAAACHASPRRWSVMYEALARVHHGERALVDDAADATMCALRRMARAVDRECHKMHAFVRFRSLVVEGGERYVAWFEPEHDILSRVAPFFVDRFAAMDWMIVTPRGAIHWDRATLRHLERVDDLELPASDGKESLWRAYYAAIFNPARLNIRTMRKELPVRYWRNLPEAHDIASLEGNARRRLASMLDAPAAAPAASSRAAAPADARGDEASFEECRRCPLWQHATHGVQGQGPRDAAIMLVGEQPGDEEDLRGLPFVGPAGRLLDAALDEAGLTRSALYLTNAVKHFKWEPRGGRRMHKTPSEREVAACATWLDREIEAIRPQMIVALGATALLALTGTRLPVGRSREAHSRGETLHHASGAMIVATWHPAAILRASTSQQAQLRSALIADLGQARVLVDAQRQADEVVPSTRRDSAS